MSVHEWSLPENFRLLHFPQAAGAKPARCIVWLHGIGERGDDLSLVSRYGLPAALKDGRLTVNADVICPQLEAGRAWSAERLAHLMAGLGKQYEASALLGYSLGADGVCQLLAQLGSQAGIHIAIAPGASVCQPGGYKVSCYFGGRRSLAGCRGFFAGCAGKRWRS